MWVDPDSGLSFEQILEKFWRALPPHVQAEYHHVMATTGQTWEQMCREAHTRFRELSAAAQADPESPFAASLRLPAVPEGP